ncbi:uncharacterized protein LOC131689803 [Topomyia yanbarensis]|uniref:uncharacterized protein LOC131689803 n=1 Tax=Topomyia yanbarensis TaxID=2498891 RepID=UPI00273B3AF9|nr:uncharacterized protein LOC131689803 [Topomyia yanbarensis]XP_058831092.1 uncharacterized protein LOC131689803 [Topomyia yanbarensis]XP_058831093.1 uncharacterized protein LOC131689803 [Topomyia yanbarensis]XP_058831095.1 uncharacterized protein LOC131689803 [Topomyia yanbarensis]
MIRPEVVQQLACPSFGLATSWMLSRKGAPADSLEEVKRCFRREFWPFTKTLPKKNADLARALREKANECYKKQPADLDVALKLYNESISHAPEESEDLGMGYANRSAVYFNRKQYRRCLSNIQLAKASNYPKNKIDNLLKREQKCFDMLQDSSIEKKQHTFSEVQLHKSDLQFADVQNCGSGFIAKRDLKVGSVFIESPALLVLEPELTYCRCNHCGLVNDMDLIPCKVCCTAMYCSEQCRTIAFDQYHRFECEIMEDLKYLFKGPDDSACRKYHLSLRLFWMAAGNLLENPIDFSLRYKNDLNRYRNSLEINTDDLPLHVLADGTSNLYSDRTGKSILQFFTILLYHIAVDENDSFPIDSAPSEHKNMLLEILYRLLQVKRIEAFQAMICFYPLLRILNHSCAPNVEEHRFGQQSVLVVKRPIKAGEQILLCYIPNGTTDTMPKEKRRTLLLKQFELDCQCLGCSLAYPPLSEIEENVALKSELEAISPKEGEQKLRALEEFLQRHDELYPQKELAYAWDMYKKQRFDKLVDLSIA